MRPAAAALAQLGLTVPVALSATLAPSASFALLGLTAPWVATAGLTAPMSAIDLNRASIAEISSGAPSQPPATFPLIAKESFDGKWLTASGVSRFVVCGRDDVELLDFRNRGAGRNGGFVFTAVGDDTASLQFLMTAPGVNCCHWLLINHVKLRGQNLREAFPPVRDAAL
mmetsp:Transcript_65752/g.183136  ORF Transcript_65752/g.183136 Transcript_65752/m.183136 type:complete len:170 (+) Transcript_65752:86-595(+)